MLMLDLGRCFMRIFLFIWILVTTSLPLEAKSSPRLDNISIIVSSCDKFSEFWNPFFTLLFKHWPSLRTQNVSVPLILISNYKTYPDSRVTTYPVGLDKSWSDNMLTVLKNIKTDYILYLQEDYFFNSGVNENILLDLLKAMQDIPYIQISDDGTFRGQQAYAPGIVIKGQHNRWRTSLQAAIWRKEAFEGLIKPGESPWQFEDIGSVRSEGIMRPFLAVVSDFPITYLNASEKGFWMTDALDYIKSQGIDVGKLNLPNDRDNWIRYQLVCFQSYYPGVANGLKLFLIIVATMGLTALATRRMLRRQGP